MISENNFPAPAAPAANDGSRPRKKEIMFHGIPVSTGIAMATLYVDPILPTLSMIKVGSISANDVQREIDIFHKALDGACDEINLMLNDLKDKEDKTGYEILEAHLLMLEDQAVIVEVENTIQRELMTAQSALKSVLERYVSALSNLNNDVMDERVADLKDLGQRLLNRMSGFSERKRPSFKQPTVILAKELSPSDTAVLNPKEVLGLATEVGGKNSHVAILARTMGIPAIVGLRSSILNMASTGDTIILDGYQGLVILNPEPSTIEYFQEQMDSTKELLRKLKQENHLPSVTLDNEPIQLMVNLDSEKNADEVKKCHAEGVGLFRSEYLFMGKRVVPDEETQFAAYKALAEKTAPLPVTIRTLDIGGDKLDFILSDTKELNPSLGMRAIRLCLDQQQLFISQLSAILRASAYGNVKLLLPMISSVSEIVRFQRIFKEVQDKLTSKGIPFDKNMQVGAMIEIPSAVLIADRLAKYVDFFSIGTNDLVQYTLAVDRSNERVSNLYNPLNPGVMKLIHLTVQAGKKANIPVCCCGELANSPKYVPVLLGLGIRQFSMTPLRIPLVRKTVRSVSIAKAETVVRELYKLENDADADDVLVKHIGESLPDLMPFLKD